VAFLIPDNLKSRSDVPAGIRRTAGAFQIGLDEDVTVWYEPLYDPSGERPHLVLLLPQWGIIVLEALEVRSGGLLGVLRGRLRLERDGREVEVENPLARAGRLAAVLRERLRNQERLRGFEIPVAAGAVFPSISRQQAEEKRLSNMLSLDVCLFKDHLQAAIQGEGEGRLLRAFTKMLGGRQLTGLPPDADKILRGIIQPSIVIDQIATGPSDFQLTIFRRGDHDQGTMDIIRVMDRQQEALAKSMGSGHRVIRGVAGSGKTLVLVFRARLLAELMPREKILVTCYTRSLAGELRQLLRDHVNVDVIHLDGLMAQVIRSARLRHPGYTDDDSGDRVARTASKALRRVPGRRYRAVLIDEAQDFSTNALQFAVALLQDGQDDLLVVADAAQNIFRRHFSWKQAGIQAQGRTRILRVNYRNTREILEFASRFLLTGSGLKTEEVPDMDDENAIIPPEAAVRSGPRPTLLVVDDPEEEVEFVVEQVKEWLAPGLRPREIAVLYGTAYEAGTNRAQLILSTLENERVDVFWLSDPNDKAARDRLPTARAPVILSTIHSAKGLEFPCVVLCGIWRSKEDADANRKLAYVGMTRAREKLTVVSLRDHPLADDLEHAVERQAPSA